MGVEVSGLLGLIVLILNLNSDNNRNTHVMG